MRDLSQHARFVVSKVGKDDEEGKDLLDAARRLADAFKDLTLSLKPDNDQVSCHNDVLWNFLICKLYFVQSKIAQPDQIFW